MAGIWPKECDGDDHSGLHLMACLACSEDQPKFTYIRGEDTKVVRVCESVLREIYGADLKQRTKHYNKCGAWSDPDTIVTKRGDTWADGFVMNTPDPVIIMPEKAYEDAE